MGRTLPGGARSTELTGLKGNTRYNVKLYASTGGKNTSPINAVAKTGTGPCCVHQKHFLKLLFSYSTVL